jgi:hypothetical protein
MVSVGVVENLVSMGIFLISAAALPHPAPSRHRF